MEESPRYRAKEPSDWTQKSAYLLARFRPLQSEVLAAFGLAAPVPIADVPDLLKRATDARPAPTVKGAPGESDATSRVLTYHDWTRASVHLLRFMPGTGPIGVLARAADLLRDESGLSEPDAVDFLLSDLPVSWPWIEVESRVTPLGPAFTIHIGSTDATAEDVRSAYNEAVREALEVQGPRRTRASRAEDFAIVMLDRRGREMGLTWAQRWNAWIGAAAEIGAAPYESAAAYRNKVNDLRRRFTWARELLDDSPRKGGDNT